MAARPQRVIRCAWCFALALGLLQALGVSGVERRVLGEIESQPSPRLATRIVSLVPALTEMLFAIGAGPQVVGVSSFDEFPPEVQKLPRVGALLNPDTERILSLKPDLVLVYGSQSDVQSQLTRAGVRTFSYRHGGIARVLESIRDLGAETGRTPEAARVTARLQARFDAVRERVKNLPRPTVLLVLERQPGTLREMFVCGGVGFLNEMIEIAGGRNVFSDTTQEAVQPSQETLLRRAPDVILEVRANGLNERDQAADRDAWAGLPSLPAVRRNRVYFLTGQYLVSPGPRLGEATETYARALHPEAFGSGK